MVVILVFLTFGIGILAEVTFRRLTQKRRVLRVETGKGLRPLSPAVAVPEPARIPQFPENIYYHKGHAWVKLEAGNRIKVGLDDFTQQVMGNIDDIEPPPLGSKLNRGEVAWKVCHGKRKLGQLAPLGGTVVEVNEKLSKNPSLVNRSPYEEGWIVKIQPNAFRDEIPELMDSFQFRMHFDQHKANLMSRSNDQTLGMVYGDGGEVIKGAAGKLDESLWKMLVSHLFHSSPE